MNKVKIIPDVELYNEDCMKVMEQYPDNYFDLAIVDPPYGIGCDGVGMSNRTSKSKKFKNYVPLQYPGGNWDLKPEDKPYFIELQRVSKNQIIWGANHFIENIPNANSSCWVVWYKNGQNPNSQNADCELAYTSFKSSVKYFRFDWSGFGFINNKENKIHPTQKPVALYKWLLSNYAKQGDKILDTHLGSGSIVIALDSMNKIEKMNLSLVGAELDKDYFKSACERIKEQTKWQSLF